MAETGWLVMPPNPFAANVSTYAGRSQPKPQVVDVYAVRAFLENEADKHVTMGRVNNGVIVPDTSTACHAFLGHLYNNKKEPSTTMFSRIGGLGQGEHYQKADNTRPAARAFFAWMFGPESPWRSITRDLNADIDWCLKHGVIVDKLDKVPANLVYNFFICTRFPGEYAPDCDWWYSLVEAGVEPWYAFYLCSFGRNGRLGYVGGHGGLERPDPLRLRNAEPNPKILTEPNGSSRPAASVWDRGDLPPSPIYLSVSSGRVDPYGPRKKLETFKQINPDFEALVAACIKEQERIGTESQKPSED